jgi:hypothetical protein
MIDALINRIKDAYFDLDRDTARGQRFVQMTQAFTPGAIQMQPSAVAQQFPPNTPLGPQPEMGSQLPEQGMPQPAPEPSLLDLIGARR